MKLAVFGHTNIDVLLDVDELPTAGVSTPVRSRRIAYGGTAANIAFMAAQLGVPVRLWSRVGPDFPDDWKERLAAAGVEVAFEVDLAGTPTCTILTDAEGAQAFAMHQGAMDALANVAPAHKALEGASRVHISTGNPQGYLDTAKRAARLGATVALDPGQELRFQYDARRLERMLDHVDTLFLNASELDTALRMMSYGDPVQLLDHVDTLVVTRGGDGASLYGHGRPVHRPAVGPVPTRDPTGAGDAVRAGWYKALAAGKDLVTALDWGQQTAAASLALAGPQEPGLAPSFMRDL